MKAIAQDTYSYQTLRLTILPLRSDNYSYVIYDEATAKTLIIDPGETQAVIDWLQERNLALHWILDTHHHHDHTEGNVGLKKHFQAKIAASAYDIELGRISGDPDYKLRDGEFFTFGAYQFRILATPGHTLGHVCLFLEGAQWLFSGDTLFSLGCGRLFEGDGPMLWESFQKLATLPDETLVFCGHEYTLANARFVNHLLPDHDGFASYHEMIKARLDNEHKTIPSRLGDEKVFNPYFLSDEPSLAKWGESPSEVFSSIRSLKDKFI